MTSEPQGPALKILYASAEIMPFAKVGGLADVAAALPKALAALGHDVRVVTPDHGGQAGKGEAPPKLRASVSFMGGLEEVEVTEGSLSPGAPIYFIGNSTFFHRPEVYGAPDDLLRYQFFSRAVLEAPRWLGWQPDILHCNDWHTAFLPFGLRNRAWGDPGYRQTASVLTIHNLGYRGPDDLTDVLSQGIYYAHVINTVSRTYAREITTPELGEGLESLLRLRQERLYGIVNGIDTALFDPATDTALAVNYDASRLSLKARNKEALQEKLGLPVAPSMPLAGMVSRLVDQKGIDLVVEVLEKGIVDLGMQFVFLGTGDPSYQQQLQDVAARHPRQVKVVLGFAPKLAQLIYGGADLFLMPSRYEPCGLGQLIAMRYGTAPVVRRTGGLADTVEDVVPDLSGGTGFVFGPYQAQDLLGALKRAAAAFQQKEAWKSLQRRCMDQDYSWSASARQYEAMYYDALAAKG